MSDRDDAFGLRGRVALVTGATSGIGEAIARRLASEGLRVAFCGRRQARLDALADALQQGGAEVLPVRADLRDPAQVQALFGTIRAAWDGVDVLVNNAGVGLHAPLTSGSEQAWREMLELNVLALCLCTREALADMHRRGVAGHVVHVSSMSAHRVPGGGGVYSASKFAVRSLTEGLRQELRAAGSRVRVSSVSPGFVETEFAARYHGNPDDARRLYASLRCLQPDDVADVVWFILSRPPHVEIHDVLLRPTEQRT